VCSHPVGLLTRFRLVRCGRERAQYMRSLLHEGGSRASSSRSRNVDHSSTSARHDSRRRFSALGAGKRSPSNDDRDPGGHSPSASPVGDDYPRRVTPQPQMRADATSRRLQPRSSGGYGVPSVHVPRVGVMPPPLPSGGHQRDGSSLSPRSPVQRQVVRESDKHREREREPHRGQGHSHGHGSGASAANTSRPPRSPDKTSSGVGGGTSAAAVVPAVDSRGPVGGLVAELVSHKQSLSQLGSGPGDASSVSVG
jgi:hypothetical protein